MNIKALVLGLLVMAALVSSGCARHVVAKPDQIEQLNDSEWTIHSEKEGEQGNP